MTEMLEKSSGLIGGLLAIISVGAAFETFTNLGLLPRLVVTAIAALLLCFWLNRLLVGWIKPPQGIIPTAPATKFSRLRYFGAVVLLLIVCGSFVLFAVWMIGRLTFQLHEMTTGGASRALLVAPYSRVDSVTIAVPPYQAGKCVWHDRSQASIPRLQLLMIDWNSTTPALQVANFEHPQRIEVNCNAARAISNVTVMPPSTAIYSANQLSSWRLWSAIAGGVIWLISAGLLYRRASH
jgi:hypothetical protein